MEFAKSHKNKQVRIPSPRFRPTEILTSDFWPLEMQVNKFLQICVDLLQRLQEMNTGALCHLKIFIFIFALYHLIITVTLWGMILQVR